MKHAGFMKRLAGKLGHVGEDCCITLANLPAGKAVVVCQGRRGSHPTTDGAVHLVFALRVGPCKDGPGAAGCQPVLTFCSA